MKLSLKEKQKLTLFKNYEGHFPNILYIRDKGRMNKFNGKFKEVSQS